MAIPSLDQRLSAMLPTATTDTPQEPMPAEAAMPPDLSVDGEPGTPNMEEGVQVAGPANAIGGILRKAVRNADAPAERPIMPGKLPEGELADPAKAGRFKLIPEADQQVTDAVTGAVAARKAAPMTERIGKPSPTPADRALGMNVEEAFNLARYQTEDAAAIVGGVADALGIRTKAVTFDEIKAKAAESGISENFLSRLVGNDGRMMANAVETYKALEVLESSANELDNLFRKVAQADATDADKLRLRQQIAFHGLLQKGIKGMQTETARALAVFRIPRDGNAAVVRRVLDEFGGDAALSDLARSYLSLETRAAQNALVEKTMMSGVKDVWFTTYINGLLASPVSHAKNIIGNSFFGLYQIPERMIASFYGNTLPQGFRSWGALVPGNADEKIALDEALVMVQSLREGLSRGLELASTAFRKNQPSDLASKIEMQRNPSESMGATLQRVFGQSPESLMGKALDYYGTAVTLPGRALMSEDEFFKGVLYTMELNTQIVRRTRQTYRNAIEDGLSETDAIARAEAEAIALKQNPPADLDEAAARFAEKGTFTADLPPALDKLQDVFNHPALKIIVPFFKTPANIGLEVLERTPLAPVVSSRFREEIAQGGIYRDMAMAKVTLGTSLMALYAAYAAEGHITGRGPERKADREALMRDGWQPYSIKVGDKYYSYAGLEPMSALMAIAADYADYARNEPDKSKVEQVFLAGGFGLYEYINEQPYLQGVADISKLIGEADSGKVKAGVESYLRQFGGFVIGGSPLPGTSSLVAGIERILDPTAKDTRASPDLPMGVRQFYEAFNRYRSRLPYANESLPDQLNLWGDPIKQGRGNPLEIVLPTRVSPEQFSEVDQALVQMGSPIGMPERKLDGVELDAKQYHRLLSIYGKETLAKEQILTVINSPGFALLSLDDQQKTVQSVHSKFMDLAKKQLISEDPDLQAKIADLQEMRKANGLYYKPD
jgi:hypothetical protein